MLAKLSREDVMVKHLLYQFLCGHQSQRNKLSADLMGTVIGAPESSSTSIKVKSQ